MTYERAKTVSIYKVVQLAAKRYSSTMGEYILALYKSVKKGYNDYVELIEGAGACAALKHKIADNLPLLHFLTSKWVLEGLFVVLNLHRLVYIFSNLYAYNTACFVKPGDCCLHNKYR